MTDSKIVTDIPTVKLNDGKSIPAIGYGTGTAWYKGSRGDIDRTLVDAIKSAISIGYVHLDGAETYGTEPELGIAIAESGMPRSALYVTTKVHQTMHDVQKALDESLKKLHLDYVDLFLIHQPYFANSDEELQQKWAEMEAVLRTGKTKSIGVSNFTAKHIEAILKTAKVVPAINQVEFHPYLQHEGLLPLLKKHNIVLEAYGSLTVNMKGAPGPADEVISRLSKKYEVGNNEVVLRWALDQGVIPITTSGKESRLKEYLKTLSFRLTPEELQEISDAGHKKHFRSFWTSQHAADDRN